MPRDLVAIRINRKIFKKFVKKCKKNKIRIGEVLEPFMERYEL